MARLLRRALLTLVLLFLVAQVLPLGRPSDNPAVRQEPAWDRPETRALAKRACFDCHSNETVWPWYAHVAPISWLVAHDVEEGREHLNFSEWDRRQENADEAAEELEARRMPPSSYLLLHAEARLEGTERSQLLAGLRATLGTDSDRGDRRGSSGSGGSRDERETEEAESQGSTER